jgi:hypothetical protein
MRTYGIDPSTGNWTVLTQAPIVGPSNPITTPINSVTGNTSYITSTLYVALASFSDGPSTVNVGDILLNDQVFNPDGSLALNTWTDIDTGAILASAPSSQYINVLANGTQGFFTAYDLTQGEVAIVDASYIWLATLAQTLRLSQNESPFYANYGIPGQQSVNSQIAPTAAINRTQAQFAQYFSSLSVVRNPNATEPTYNITAVFLNGTVVQSVVAT